MSEARNRHIPELLAPAGDFLALRAAVGNGADAVYLGAGTFNARQNATNFSPEQLTEAIEFCHLHSVRAYLTMNTLIADDEGSAALELAAAAYADGIDALIVQDIGLAGVLHRELPDLPLFASTQMTISNEAGLHTLARLGIKRVILPRELSIPEIGRLTAMADRLGLATEVFVHGALCVCYSGQCLLSSLIGGRSGNRGACAQPCRLSWQIARATPDSPMSKPWPWLSPRDQALIDHLPALRQAGVASLKIEGRMRGSAYVGPVVAQYRAALDQLASGQPAPESLEKNRRRLLLAFNRGGSFTDRYPSGKRQPDFLSGSYSGNHGLLLGRIIGLQPRLGILRLMLDPQWPSDELPERGDFLSVRKEGADQETASAPIGEITQQGRTIQIKGFHPDVLEKFDEGNLVYRMTDRSMDRASQQADLRRTNIAIRLEQNLEAGNMVRLTAMVEAGQGAASGIQATCSRPAELVAPINPERVVQQLQKSGSTPFRVADVSLAGDVNLTIAGINDMRRQLLDDLAVRVVNHFHRQLPLDFCPSWPEAVLKAAPAAAKPAAWPRPAPVSAYLYQMPEKPEMLACGADRYYVPILALSPQNAPALRESLRAREPDSRLLAWLPPAAAGRSAELLPELIKSLPNWGFDGFCAGQAGLDYLYTGRSATLEKVADSGANIFNQASYLDFASQGASSICPSLELSAERLKPLLQTAAASGVPLELPVYGRLRLMISEFCPIGQNLAGCKRCLTAELTPEQPDLASLHRLVDRRQQSFPLLPHPRVCISELLSHFILCAPQDFLALQAASQSPRDIQARLYFLGETPAERSRLTSLCREMMLAEDPDSQAAYAGQFQQTAAKIAGDAFCQLGFGHYRRGV